MKAGIWLPHGLAAICSFRGATGDQARLLWSMLSCSMADAQVVMDGRVVVAVIRRELELYACRELRGARGLELLQEAARVSTISAPGSVLDGHHLFADVIQVKDESGRAAVGIVLSDGYAEHGATLNEAAVGIPIGVWSGLRSYLAVDLAVRAAAMVTGEKRKFSRTITKATMGDHIPGAGGVEIGMFRRQFVDRALEDLKAREVQDDWLRWAVKADKRRNATKLVITAVVADNLKQLTHPGPRPRLKFRDLTELNQLRGGEDAARAVRRRKKEAAAADAMDDEMEIG